MIAREPVGGAARFAEHIARKLEAGSDFFDAAKALGATWATPGMYDGDAAHAFMAAYRTLLEVEKAGAK